ncbi:MAG: hypothetical protein IKT52_04560 [Oscillospiraceae bacterium]|nr:hypothetical protein [Oscillospiraceae bacterium]
MSLIQEFIESIDVPNTEKVVRYVLDGVEVDFETMDIQQLEQFVLSREPNSPKAIATICYVLGAYARWLQEEQRGDGNALYELIQSLDKKYIWNRAKPAARRKFITYNQFCRVISEIGICEEFNQLYYQTLFRCVYEGIYNDDMSVLKNLRGSDVCGEYVTLHEDNGHTYKLKISIQLARDLVELSKQQIWERKNRYGLCRVHMRGLYNDSVFKIEERKNSSPNTEESYKFSLYAKIRKITGEYLAYRIMPFPLYVSGLMHRITLRLIQTGISVEETFSENSRNRTASEIVSSELLRCNYTSGLANFREIVRGQLDQF